MVGGNSTMRADIRGVGKKRQGRALMTYNNEAADCYQVPEDVFLGRELGVGDLHLLEVIIDKPRVHDDSNFRFADEEVGDQTPDLGRETEETLFVETNPERREPAQQVH